MGKTVFILLLLVTLIGVVRVKAQTTAVPANDRARGLVFDGLTLSNDCPAGFKIHSSPKASGRPTCTHGPDLAPEGFDVTKSVDPITTTNITTSTSPICDGDGTSGRRVQLIYARAADVPDRYGQYLSSFKQWAAEADAIYLDSASKTNGGRRIRFVHDANCSPAVANVVLSSTGDDSFGNTITELWAQGFNRSDRKYISFVDARVYCGIGMTEYDDTPGPANYNNAGPHYGRIDSGCWSAVVPAHELMHTIGAVQLSAPHSDGSWHCTDGADAMCDRSGIPLACYGSPPNWANCPCPDPTIADRRFDCKEDDYYHTNPPAGSYLATHWNSAKSLFLIEQPPPTPILGNGDANLDNSLTVDDIKTVLSYWLARTFPAGVQPDQYQEIIVKINTLDFAVVLKRLP